VAPRFVYRIRLTRTCFGEVVSNYFWGGTIPFFPEEHHPLQAEENALAIQVATMAVRTVFDRAIGWQADAYEVLPWHRVAPPMSGYFPPLIGPGVVPGLPGPPWLAVPLDRVNSVVRDTRLWWRHVPRDYVSADTNLNLVGRAVFAVAFAAMSLITYAVSPTRQIVEQSPFMVGSELLAYKRGRLPWRVGDTGYQTP
jgi:hypothetical protein